MTPRSDGDAEAKLADAYAQCFATLREHDPDLWLASLYWPEAARRHTHAILAFAVEIERIRDAVTDPTLGEIRHQWWREAIETDAPAGNPVAVALVDTIARFNLDKARLLALIEARGFDLYDDPMPSEHALETYARDTCVVPFEAVARVLAPGRVPPPCVESAGRAFALTRILRGLPYQVMRGQLYLPLDVLERLQVKPEIILAHRNSPGLGLVLQTLRARVRVHLCTMRETLHGAGPARAACLPAFLCEPMLRRMEAPALDPFATPIDLPAWRRQWILWRAARRL